jgi:hypothetical protein
MDNVRGTQINVNIAVNDTENNLDDITVTNGLGTTGRSNKQNNTHNRAIDILGIILGDVHNGRNATFKHKIKQDRMTLKGNKVKIMMVDNVKLKGNTVADTPIIKEVRKIDIKKVISGMKKT